jgi:hypothetical protein
MSVEGVKHLIQCHCVLPQFRNTNPPVFHKFIVFSIIEDDEVKEKVVQCNNCGVLHKVIDQCRSEILHGKDTSSTIRTVEDVEVCLPERLAAYLKTQNVDMATWEQVEFIVDGAAEDTDVVIRRDEQGANTSLKIMTIKRDGNFKVRSEIVSNTLEA